MAVGKLSGVMLQNNLDRQGVDLTFDGNLLHLNVALRRVGINTTDSTVIREALTVVGNVKTWNTVTNTSSYFIGNISPVNVANIAGPDTIVHVIGPGAVALPQGNANTRPANAAAGSIRHLYETTGNVVNTSSLEWYDGTQWVVVGSGQNESVSEIVTSDGANITYALTQTNAAANSTALTTLVVINGVVQEPDQAYTLANSNITFAEPPATTDRIVVRYLGGGIQPKTYPILVGSLANITNSTPASSSATGSKGDISYDGSFLYICVSANTWIRSNIQTSF
jgi:hypothetical protein